LLLSTSLFSVVSCLVFQQSSGSRRLPSTRTVQRYSQPLVRAFSNSQSVSEYSVALTMSPVEDDPFEAFGNDSDDDDAQEESASAEPIRRDPSCGALVFREGTEQAMLLFVRNELERSHTDANGNGDSDVMSPREKIMKLVDTFCYSRHWMMHVGPEKGVILQDFLTRRVHKYLDRADFSSPFMIVEVGTYCGYSSIRMAHTVLELLKDTPAAAASFHILTVDVDPNNISVARQMVALAELESHFTFIRLKDPEHNQNELSQAVRSNMMERFPEREAVVDFLFLDHAKELYLSDLVQLEDAVLIKADTWVAADNILFFRLDEYRQHVQALALKGIVETLLKVGKLEYVDDQDQQEDLRDGLGKFSLPSWMIQCIQMILCDAIRLTTCLLSLHSRTYRLPERSSEAARKIAKHRRRINKHALPFFLLPE
jgi:catechol O-methyltransferase